MLPVKTVTRWFGLVMMAAFAFAFLRMRALVGSVVVETGYEDGAAGLQGLSR